MSSTMTTDSFWCDLLETWNAHDTRSSLKSLLPFSHDGKRFSERAYLQNANTLNVLLLDAVFQKITGGLRAPRTLMVPRFSNRKHTAQGIVTFEECVNLVFTRTKYLYLYQGPASLVAPRQAYEKTLIACRGNPDAVKRETLKRIAERLHVPAGTPVEVETAQRQPLHVAYASMVRRCCDKYLTGDPYAVDRRAIASLLPEEFPSSSSVPAVPVNAILEVAGGFHGKSSAGSSQHTMVLTLQEYLTHCIVSDGYFLRKIMSPSPAATWLHVRLPRREEKEKEEEKEAGCRWRWEWWATDLVRSRVAYSPQTTLITFFEEGGGIEKSVTNALRRSLTDLFENVFPGIRLQLLQEGLFFVTRNGSPTLISSTVLGDYRRSMSALSPLQRPWTQLCADYVKTRLALTDTTAPTAVAWRDHLNKTAAFLGFVLDYVVTHDLMNRKWKLDSRRAADNRPLYAVMLIESRQTCALTVVSALMALHNLRTDNPGCRWRLHAFCSDQNRSHMRSYLGACLEDPDSDLEISVLDELSIENRFEIDDYSALLKSSRFWRRLSHYDKCLLIQNDGMLVLPGVERMVHEYDYLAAPWLAGQTPLQEMTNPELVGNGGISVRKIGAMLDICAEAENGSNLSRSVHELFINGAQPLPEDVFFSRGMYLLSDRYKLAPRHVAERFSSEEYVSASGSIAFHKPWPYHSLQDMEKFFSSLMQRSVRSLEPRRDHFA